LYKIIDLKKSHLLFLLIVSFSFFYCAKKGRPSGGPKDEDAPLLVTSSPPYETINFNTDEIKIEFNEYITLKDLNKQLVVSPPLKEENPSIITPQGTPSKFISIKILDTLLKNTTYIFNFGNSVQDNNEGNKLESFKYVFSTGSYIDSLNLSGSVKNAYSSENIKNIKMLLYRLDSTFTDSIVYKQKPNYVASTLDTSNYKFTNLKKGNYFLVAIKDKASDYIFDPKNDEIGFYRDTITLPQDSIISKSLSVFKEILPYKFRRGKEARKGQLIFSYEGDAKNLKTELITKVPEDFKMVSIFEKDKDTLNLWHSPIEKDSLIFKVINGKFLDTVTVKLRKKKLDSLIVTPETRSVIQYKDTLFYKSNNPIVKIDTTKVSFYLDKDSTKVAYTPFISEKDTKVGFLFQKSFKENYTIKLNPEALTDIFNQTSDSIQTKFRTRDIEDYGDITIALQNIEAIPVIVELIDVNEKLIERKFTSETTSVKFQYLEPKKYRIRVIYDVNNNRKWDTGDFLLRAQPEKIEYYKDVFEVRAFFSINEIITIKL
jgi:uncharacterized protein (DUF2141 family)